MQFQGIKVMKVSPINVSFEFFPPGSEDMLKTLWQSVEKLAPLDPSFVSVTYGADGSTRTRTHDVIKKLKQKTTLPVAAHLTCVGATQDEVLEVAQEYWDLGVRHIVALRGDPPQGEKDYQPHSDGFAFAADLVAGLKTVGDFEISVAAYPEVHPEAKTPEFDLDNLRRKVDAGATRAITQFFFDNNTFLRFRDKCSAAGIRVPIVPGILPITKFPQLTAFAARCGTTVPSWLEQRFQGLEEDAETRQLIAASVAIDQVQTLQKEGVTDFHFYTLNRSDLTYAICHSLNVRPRLQKIAI